MSLAHIAINFISNVFVALAALVVIHHNEERDRKWRILRFIMLISLVVSAKNIVWVLIANPTAYLSETLPNTGFAVVSVWIVWVFIQHRPALKNDVTDRLKATFLTVHPK